VAKTQLNTASQSTTRTPRVSPVAARADVDFDKWVRDTSAAIVEVVKATAAAYGAAHLQPPATQAVVDAFVDVVLPTPQANEMVTLLAPYWSSAKLTEKLGVSRQALDSRMKGSTLLGLKTTKGSLLFPVFQFRRDVSGAITVRQEVIDMLKAVRNAPAYDGWAFATLLRTPVSALDNLTPYEWSRDPERDPAALRSLARLWQREWSH
jgi:hypothetical protein